MSTQELPGSRRPHGRGSAAGYVGRVGALAVALGVGTALATSGTAHADTGDAGSATASADGSSADAPAADRPSTTESASESADTRSGGTARRTAQRDAKEPTSKSRLPKKDSRSTKDDESLERAVREDRDDVADRTAQASPQQGPGDAPKAISGSSRAISLRIGTPSPTARSSATSPAPGRATTDVVNSVGVAQKTLASTALSGGPVPGNRTPKAPTSAQVMMTLLSWARREIESALGIATTRGKTAVQPTTTLPVTTTTGVTMTALKVTTSAAATVPSTDVVIDAETMTVSPAKAGTIFNDSAASGGRGLQLKSNATVSKTVSTPASSALVIRARGDQYNGAPSMTVSVDGKVVSTTQVSSTTWTDYRIPVNLAAGTHTVSIAFTNAATKNAAQGRYLRLDKVTVVANTVTTPAPPPSSSPSTTPPYFQAADWLWKPIGSNPALAANSATWVGYLSDTNEQRIANLYEYGVTLVPASAITSTTPRYDVKLTQPWGSDPFGSYTVPIPVGTKVPPGSDGQIAILDPTTGQAFGIWQAKYDSATNTWSGSWGGMGSLSGNGVDTSGSATATNLARYAGVVTAAEFSTALANNTGLNHALFVASDIVGPGYVGPATKSDGTNLAGVAVPMPEGYRIQLDPSINVDAIPGITPGEKVIAKTLQTYGAYVGDQGDARMSFAFEAVPDATYANPGSVWVNSGLAWDYYDMDHIPWSQLRVLEPTTTV